MKTAIGLCSIVHDPIAAVIKKPLYLLGYCIREKQLLADQPVIADHFLPSF